MPLTAGRCRPREGFAIAFRGCSGFQSDVELMLRIEFEQFCVNVSTLCPFD